ncbi:hypothetical protein AVEN_2308-1 [Araneus ventricosus]|uniref:Uncharacterized protein n=1 Tax=Araneus ventricosus TaxID=182803 RepID=A0A4Y2RVP9_ARAVE|nr:hypothetical protein AVEN_2308-1 [Araneus ventricosus]
MSRTLHRTQLGELAAYPRDSDVEHQCQRQKTKIRMRVLRRINDVGLSYRIKRHIPSKPIYDELLLSHRIDGATPLDVRASSSMNRDEMRMRIERC